MGFTLTEKIIGNHAIGNKAGKHPVHAGDCVWARANGLMMHDVTSTGEIAILKKFFGGRIAKGLKVVVTPDHYVPAKDIASAKLYQELREFVDEQTAKGADISAYMLEGGNYGVCHVMVPEMGHILPGQLWFGADSHTCQYGFLGAFSTGIGSTEGGNVLATGDLWLRVPESIRIEVDGNMPRNVMAKDLFLRVVGDIGVDGANYQAMEWGGGTIRRMSNDERATLTNQAIETGGKSGIIEPDETTRQFLKERLEEVDEGFVDYALESDNLELLRGKFCSSNWRERGLFSDPDAQYARRIPIDASGLEPLVAKPHLPSNVAPARDLQNVKINQAYIAGCTGGKWEDIAAAAEVLKGQKIAKGVRLMVVPATTYIQDRMVREGVYDTLRSAGAIVTMPTCGACLGGHMGILAPGETCISDTNRNFVGRMGSPQAFVYLASPKTVAASALAGNIVGAEK